MLQFIFWTCISLVLYTYIGYAILIYVLARLFPYPIAIKERSQNNDGNDLPPLTLFITAYNESEIIPEKMLNCLELDYPKDKLNILWVIDGSTDDSCELLTKYSMVKIVSSAHRKGKTAAVNHGMEYVKTPIVVFSDANCLLNAGALKIIARQFEDPTIGCVSGEKRVAFDDGDTVSSKGEGAYWKYESLLKKLDYEFYSAVGAAGELFALRTELFAPMEEDTLLDDFMLSMRIAQKGYRIAYTPNAYAVEYGSLNMEEEGKRKRRIAAGGWQSIGRLLPLLNGFKFGKLSFQYISHRVLRWSVTPFALFALFPLAAILGYRCSSSFNVFSVIFVFQCVFYLCAAFGYLMRNNPNSTKLFYIPYYFLFMNINVIRGIYYLFSRSFIGGWEKSQRK
ncbi:MAG: glycosyltransferase family 2 protein [Sphingobacterium sp.]|jgi:cellulose synthase/poly-beta-1,6-N-acetylglucosamine synthase-like glycosyltransferase|uniref:glycosyltransferase family 2 protein n=1 Tax=Sphingobacterium sp. TaxID=341027 RepID=UPI00284D7B04|nr:glycosyltransferase family 2 protein [Sphingobacterium sp.]MDR3011546.1 glycosyltransferase family 2 protein [Sphingobacterium sp.]